MGAMLTQAVQMSTPSVTGDSEVPVAQILRWQQGQLLHGCHHIGQLLAGEEATEALRRLT